MNGMRPVCDLSKRILEEIDQGESQDVGFESGLPDDERFLRTVVAFSNGAGGRILFGVEDDGTITGILDDSLFPTMDAIADSITASCRPMISPDIFNVTVEDRNVIVVDIRPGRDSPYYLGSEGKAHGTYVRVAGITKAADQDMQKSLEIRGSRRSFDRLDCPSVRVEGKELNDLCRRLSGYGSEFTLTRLENMGVISQGPSGYTATNAYALLTSNPFPHARIQCACFSDDKGLVFADSADFERDIVSQVEGAYDFTLRHLNTGSETGGLIGKDAYEIPAAAIREAIVNAVVHRDYSMQTRSIFVRVFDDHIEIESPGLLLVNLSELATGRSEIRNQAIASVFKAMGLIERYGKGTGRMIELCMKQGCDPPDFSVNDEFFKVSFNRPIHSQAVHGNTNVAAILECIRMDPTITQSRISQDTGISLSTVKRAMMKLQDEGIISREGSRKSGTWIINRPKDAN